MTGLKSTKLYNRYFAYFVLIVGLIITVWAWKLGEDNINNKISQDFNLRATNIREALGNRIQGYQHLLQSSAGLVSFDKTITREQWHGYCEAIGLKKNYPAVQALAFAKKINASELDEFTNEIRASGLQSFSVRPPGAREQYVVNVFAEPFEGLNIKAVGYDMWQDAIRRNTMEEAIKSNSPKITPKTALKIDEESKPVPAVIMYMPAYASDGVLSGFALVPVRIHELVSDLQSLATSGVSLSVYDGETVKDEALLYAGPKTDNFTPKLGLTEKIAVGGRVWTLVFQSEPILEAVEVWRSPMAILGMGMVFSLMLSGIVWSLATSKQRAVSLAETMTLSLRESEEKLRRINVSLTEQKGLLSSIIDGTSDAVFVKDTEGRYKLVNREVERIFALPEGEIIGHDDARFFASDEAARMMSGDKKIMEGGIVITQEEYITTVEGPRVYLATKGPLFNDQGTVAGMFGISRDVTERKKIEEQLEVLSRRLQLATKSAGMGIWDWDVVGNTMVWDDRMMELYGYTTETFPGGVEAWEGGLHPEDRDRAWAECQSALRGESEFNTEFRVLHPNGRIRHLKADGVVLRDPQGAPLRMLGINYDITEIKISQEQLKNSNERYQHLIDHAREGIFTLAQDGTFLFVNDGISEISGYSRQELLGMTIQETYPENMRADVQKRLSEIASRGWLRFERPMVRRDGHIIELEVSAWGTGDGTLQAIVRDVTERKKLEEELSASRELFGLFMRYSPIYTFIKEVTPTESRVLQASDNFEKMVGVKGSEMIGRTMGELFPQDFAEKITRDDWLVVTRGEVFELEEELNGRHYTTIKFPITQGDKNLLAGFTIDVTDRKRAEGEAARLMEHLTQSQKLESIGKLAGGVAHDFNNMLGVILGHAELALNELGASHPVSGHLKEIDKAATRSAAITRQLLAFARKQTIAPKVLNLNETLEPMLKMIKRLIGEDIDLDWRPGEGLWNIKIDPSQVDQILANLATNARDAISGNGSVVIETLNATIDKQYYDKNPLFPPGRYVVLRVRDDGCGIEPEKITNIFDPFFTTKEFGKGTGLGLATVYGIVKQNGGFIDVKSRPGEGSEFDIYLPMAESPAHEGTTERADIPGGSETILIVEDEVSSLNLLDIYLTSLGYHVIALDNPRDAKAVALANSEIDLLITDVIMPFMDGRQLAEELISLNGRLRCLFMSGYTADVIADRGVLSEGVNFIQKPYSLKEMAAKVRQVLTG